VIGLNLRDSDTRDVLRNIERLLLQLVTTELREIVFKGSSMTTHWFDDWLGVINAIENFQFSNLRRIQFECRSDPSARTDWEIFVRKNMKRCDALGILDFR
jgi:hypothetical protein